MAERQPFRFRLPWLVTAPAPRPAAEPQPPRPAVQTQAPAQPAATAPVLRPPFRPPGRAPVQPPPPQAQAPPRIEAQPPPPPSPPRVTTEPRPASQPPQSPSRATTQRRAASVPPSSYRSAPQPPQPATQMATKPESPSPVASDRPAGRTSTQPSSPLLKAIQIQPSDKTTSLPPSPPNKLQSTIQETSKPPPSSTQPLSFAFQQQEPKAIVPLQQSEGPQPKTEITSKSTVSESKNQTPIDGEAPKPTQLSGRPAIAAAAPKPYPNPIGADHLMPLSQSEKMGKEMEAKKAVEEPVKEEKTEEWKKAAEEIAKEKKTDGPASDKLMQTTITKLLDAASGLGTQTKELLSAAFPAEQRQQEKQEGHEKKQTWTNSIEKQIKTVSSTFQKDRNMLSNSHQSPVISNGERVPLHKEIREDISKFVHKLTAGQPKQAIDGKPATIITLAGENRGASMQLGSESGKKNGSVHIHRGYKTNPDDSPEATTEGEESSKGRKSEDSMTTGEQGIKTYINSNAQGINNSLVVETSIKEMNPGVNLVLSNNQAEPTKPSAQPEPLEIRKAEFNTTPSQKLTYDSKVKRRCLRGLFMESSDSDTDNPDKPRRHGCRYNCGEKSNDKEDNAL